MSNQNTAVSTKAQSALEVAGSHRFPEIARVAQQMEQLLELQKAILKEDIDFMKLEGTGRYMLGKPGAEKMRLAFQLEISEPQVEVINLTGEHREYYATIKVFKDGKLLGANKALCSTMEVKYRWRASLVNTGKPVPKEYWDERGKGFEHAAAMLGGPTFRPKKVGGQWVIFQDIGERVENPDLADLYHTVCSMAQKRAYVAAVIQATGSSFLYTLEPSEVEAEYEVVGDEDNRPKDGGTKAKTHAGKAESGTPTGNGGNKLVEAICKQIRAKRVELIQLGFEEKIIAWEVHEVISPLNLEKYDLDRLKKILADLSAINQKELDAAGEAIEKDKAVIAIGHLLGEITQMNSEPLREKANAIFKKHKLKIKELAKSKFATLVAARDELYKVLEAHHAAAEKAQAEAAQSASEDLPYS